MSQGESGRRSTPEPGGAQGPTLGELGEDGILRVVFAAFRDEEAAGGRVLVGPGDDTALLATGGAVLATTDTVVAGRDWRDDWSTGRDVGAKVVAQNLADLAAMGGAGTGLLVTLVAPGHTPAAWVEDLTAGIAAAARAARVPVIGGDLSSTEGPVMVSVTALGELTVARPVLRSGARPGHVLAVAGPVGRSAAGLELLRAGWDGTTRRDLVDYHRAPTPDLAAGPAAAAAGASAMIDVSDGLVRDAGRLARASAVLIDLDADAVGAHAAALTPELPEDVALDCVLRGGEEHEMLATFPDGALGALTGWMVIGRVREAGAQGEAPAPGVRYRGEPLAGGGWDHFGG
ncbi:thiamine-phosphate kinase [Ornithinicoccus hortensis]|uniref:Thiamine-monophosphate kinase n=1 Tax=Ornithinicoccus hortensis TaxID=82346 RepID=A0A542YRM6_9MICO|nr:thiamine-phosphate kinase [Ornithinicoccus hortensis]TQL50721.1 thiamine-phosphate kinase [Ornithinicoccus hortensis]